MALLALNRGADTEVNDLIIAGRMRRALKLSLMCLPYNEISRDRYERLFAYSDAFFKERPWDSENVEDVIYSVNGLFVHNLISDGGRLMPDYFEILRNRMMLCARYKSVSERCKASAAYALGLLGNRRAKYDPLLLDTSIKEFQEIERGGALSQMTRELYITTLTLFAGALDFNSSREKYLLLQRESLRLFDDIPEESRTESMKEWSSELKKWFNSGSKSKFTQRSWLYFGIAVFKE